ncbi:MAG: AraC family transcriptional regulator [Bacteroidota bacterium]
MKFINHPWLNRLHAIIEENLSKEDMDNSKLSEFLGISERQLYRRCKEITKKTPNEYIRLYRLNKAKEMLENGQFMTIKETCYAVGYVNVGYFQKQFKQLHGVSTMEVLRGAGWR